MEGKYQFLDMTDASPFDINALTEMLFTKYCMEQHRRLFRLTKRSCDDDEYSTIVDTPCVSKDSIPVFLRTFHGATITLEVAPMQSILSLKGLLLRMHNIPVKEQRLSYGGAQLEDDLLIQDYHIPRNATLQLDLRVRGGCYQLFGKMLTKPFELHVGESDDMRAFSDANKHESVVAVWINRGGVLDQGIIFPLDEDFDQPLEATVYDTTYSKTEEGHPVFIVHPEKSDASAIPVDNTASISSDSSNVSKKTNLSRRSIKKPYVSMPYVFEDTAASTDDEDFKPIPTRRKLELEEKKKFKSTLPIRVKDKKGQALGDSEHGTENTPKSKRCPKCEFSTNKKSTLDRHVKTHDKKHQIKCPEPKCDRDFHTKTQLEDHFQNHHSKPMEKEKKTFETYADFKSFVEDLQSTQFAVYRKTQTNPKTGRESWFCNRSGSYESQANWKTSNKGRMQKKGGSIKCGHNCPSRIYAYPSLQDSSVKIEYHKTHIGHTLSAGKVGLTITQKIDVAAKLQLGVPMKKVLQGFRSSISLDLNRVHLSTMQDIRNIGAQFNLHSNVRLDTNDAVSIDAIVELLNEDGGNMLYYKRQDETDMEFPMLKKDDFLLAYMNSGQEEMLKLYGNNIVCIDSTHGTNGYGFEMTTLVVIDDRSQGFPVAIFFHSSKTQETYKVFFEHIKRRLNAAVTPKVFMSDDEQAFYNAWKQVMGEPKKKLLCAWHVWRNWWSNLKRLVPDKNEDHKKIYNQLQFILKELDELTFETAYNAFLFKMDSDDKFEEFKKYLVDNYGIRKEQWAYCYRLLAGINTNMYLESLHRDLKYNYLDGKKIKRLDDGFAAVQKFILDKQIKRIIAEERHVLGTKDRISNQAHKKVWNLPPELLSQPENKTYWNMVSLSNPESRRTYQISENTLGCPHAELCPEMCTYCKHCKHVFQCTCYEYSIRNNMCKHVHYACLNISVTKSIQTEDISDDEDNLIIDTNFHVEQANQERKAHLQDIAKARTKVVDLKRGDECYNSIRLLVQNPEGQKLFEDSLRRLKASLTSLNEATMVTLPMSVTALKEPPNKKIAKQRGPLKSTRKIKKVKKTPKQPDSTVVASQLGTLRFLPAADDL